MEQYMRSTWLQSDIRGCTPFPISFIDTFESAFMSGRYNDSNWITGPYDTNDYYVSQSSRTIVILVVRVSNEYEDFVSGTVIPNLLGNLTVHAYDVDDFSEYTLSHQRGASSNAIVKSVGTSAYGLHWAYDIATITPSSNTNADGVPLTQRLKLDIHEYYDGKDETINLAQNGKYLKIIELANGYQTTASLNYNEMCPSNLSSVFDDMINGKLLNHNVALLYPRTKNYILPGVDIDEGSFPDGSLFHRMLLTSWNKQLNNTHPSYSTVGVGSTPNHLVGDFLKLYGKLKVSGAENEYKMYPRKIISDEVSTEKFVYDDYVEFDVLFQQYQKDMLDYKHYTIYAFSNITLMLRNQYPGVLSSENMTDTLWEFYNMVRSGSSSTRQQLDNIKLSLMSSTLKLPFYSVNRDVINNQPNEKASISFAPFDFSFGYGITNMDSNDYDIFDSTHNFYVKFYFK